MACPFSDHKQDCHVGWVGHLSYSQYDESTVCTCKRGVNTDYPSLCRQLLAACAPPVSYDAVNGRDYDWIGEAQGAIDAAKTAGVTS